MTKRMQLTVLSSFLTFGLFAQEFHFELTPLRTKEAMKKYASHPTVYKLETSKVETVKYDTIQVENPRYKELTATINEKKESLVQAKSSYANSNKEQNWKNTIYENINSFKSQSGSFKKKKQLLIDAQSYVDSLGLNWFVYPKSFSQKIEYKKMRLENTLNKHLTQYTNELFRHVGESRAFDDSSYQRDIRELERLLSITPKTLDSLQKSESTGKRSALLITGQVDDISTLNGNFHYVTYDDIVVFEKAFDQYAQNEVVDKNDIQVRNYSRYTNFLGDLMVNDETGEQYLTSSRFLADYGVDNLLLSIEKDVKSFGYELVNIEGDMYIDTGKRKLFVTTDIFENLSKSYIDEVRKSVDEFERLKPQYVALMEKLQNHYAAFKNFNMTTQRRATWKRDCQKGIDMLERMKSFKGRQGDSYLDFQKHFKGGDAHTKFVDFQLVVMNTRRKLGM